MTTYPEWMRSANAYCAARSFTPHIEATRSMDGKQVKSRSAACLANVTSTNFGVIGISCSKAHCSAALAKNICHPRGIDLRRAVHDVLFDFVEVGDCVANL